MRRNFAEILKTGKIDYINEYGKFLDFLYAENIFYNGMKVSLHTAISSIFYCFYLRGTCLTLEEFDKEHGFNFIIEREDVTIDNLVSIMEYLHNILLAYRRSGMYGAFCFDDELVLSQITAVSERIGYKAVLCDEFYIYVENDPVVNAVAECTEIPDEFSYKLLMYDHHSMRGDIEAKKEILIKLAGLLESREKTLNRIDSRFKNDLFYIFNNLNIRHNNVDAGNKGKYKKNVAEMGNEKIEFWYDETYRMCLLAFLRLEHEERKPKFDELKEKIESEV